MLDKPEEILDKSQDKTNKLKEISDNIGTDSIIYAIKTLSEYSTILKSAGNPRAVLESVFVKLCSPECDEKSEAYGARLAKMENIIKNGINITAVQNINTIEKPMEEKKEERLASEVDVPPFDMGNEFVMPSISEPAEEEIPLPQEPAVITEEFEIPPMPEPVFFDEPAVEPVMEEPKASSSPVKDEGYKAFLKLVEGENPPLSALLINTKREIKNDKMYIVFEDGYLRDMVAKNDIFLNTLKRLSDLPVKLVTEKEDSTANDGDPLDEIIGKMDQWEQINLF
jgi:DNA polymerase III gamma/tau subunit